MASNSRVFYTIEQIELLRRIRNSGLTKEQVIHAYDSFERLDAELGNMYNSPMMMTSNRAMNGLTGNITSLNRRWLMRETIMQLKDPNDDAEIAGTASSQEGFQVSTQDEETMDPSCESPNGPLSIQGADTQMQSGAIVSSSNFISDFNMSHSQGIGKNESEPEGLAVNFAPRRERFTFRKEHLEVLEKYFKTNQYPSFEDRSDIAQRCNKIMMQLWDRVLGEKEKMSHQNVAYWFSNRRKDIKRLAKEGGIETTEVILPSKINKTPSAASESEASNYYMWASEAANNSSYSPLQAPIVGPIVFPGFMRRGPSDASAILDLDGASSNSQDMQKSDNGCAHEDELLQTSSSLSETACVSKIRRLSAGFGSVSEPSSVRISSNLFQKTVASPLPCLAETLNGSPATNNNKKTESESSSIVVKLEPRDGEDESY